MIRKEDNTRSRRITVHRDRLKKCQIRIGIGSSNKQDRADKDTDEETENSKSPENNNQITTPTISENEETDDGNNDKQRQEDESSQSNDIEERSKTCWHTGLPGFLISGCCVVAVVFSVLHVEHRRLPGIVNCTFFCIPALLQPAGAYGESADGHTSTRGHLVLFLFVIANALNISISDIFILGRSLY